MTVPAKAPGAIITTINGSFWVHETPGEINEKREEAEGVSDTIRLGGLESTPEPGQLDAYTLDINPMFIVSVRGISQRSFNHHTGFNADARPGEEGQQASAPIGFFLAGRAAGDVFEPHVVGETDPDRSCCCGHPAEGHYIQTESPKGPIFTKCLVQDCGCGCFHVHDE